MRGNPHFCVVCCFGAAVALLLALGSIADADDGQQLLDLEKQFNEAKCAARYAEAEQAARQMVAIAERSYKDRPTIIATCINNLAILYETQGRYAAAEPLYRRSLDIYEKQLGRDHPRVATALNNVANLYSTQGRYGEAEPLYQWCLAIREKKLGPDHPDVASVLNNLALLYKDKGECIEAEPLNRRALRIMRETNVEPELFYRCCWQGAEIQWALGERKRAMPLLSRAMDLAEQIRTGASGDERDRARVFGRYDRAFELMVSWQQELSNLDAALSATLLVNLDNRRQSLTSRANQPVLSLGDPVYRQASTNTNELIARPGTRYASLGGQLQRLIHSGTEAQWVQQVFGKQGIDTRLLTRQGANEKAFRTSAMGREIVHLACHGLVDQQYGNFFGALALTPQGDHADDDGFLTLPEIYNLDLKDCELAILSACDTNFGPQQKGEGVWALSRGFLVAGSRRVVASNWLVDDQAASSLVSVYCSLIARARAAGQRPDYATALHQAERWLREQDGHNSPYYWGTFVLVGPH